MTEHSYSHEIVLRLQKASDMKAQANYVEAVEILQSVIDLEPECAPAYNNLGAIYYLCKNYDLAVQAFQVALDIRPDYVDVYYNLGLAYTRLQHNDEAMMAYRALLVLVPAHPGAHFQLGCLLMQRQQYHDAVHEFSLIARSHPSHFESMANLAVCHLHLGRFDQAVKCYLRALEIVPDDPDTLFNLGVIYIQQGYTVDGIGYYLRAIKAKPDYFDAHHNLGTVYLMRRDREQALFHLREALRIRPDAEALRHLIKVLMQDKQLTGSSPEYIQSLFDSYADYYDVHLRTNLHYRVPEQFYALLGDAGAFPVADWVILDIGCGTGLCGELFREHARRLVGVDLSPRMLEIARQKKIYDELVTADVNQYLSGKVTQFDLILAGDVLVYFGKLDDLILFVSRALKPHGYFAFNVELTDEGDYAVTASGRFVHHRAYLDRLAREHGFLVVNMDPDTMRSQQDKPVQGYLCLWRLQGSGAA